MRCGGSHRYPQGGRKIPARLPIRHMSNCQSALWSRIEPATPVFRPDQNTSDVLSNQRLVTMGWAFYNPPNTALDIVGMSIRRILQYCPSERIERYRERVLELPLHFRISQEH